MNKKQPNKTYKTNVGENIFYWRKLKGLKQEDLAARIGISATALSNIENGVSKPHIERLEDIADALEIELAQLLQHPGQILSTNNSFANDHVMNGAKPLLYHDKDLLQRLTTVMETIATYMAGNTQAH